MSSLTFPNRFLSDKRGSVAEFALVLPLSMLFLVGIIDAGRYAYTFNRGEKATQTGARFAVVTEPITPELKTKTYVNEVVGSVTLTQGDRIPADALGVITCNETSCTCTSGTCPTPLTKATGASSPFNLMLTRMQQIMPEIKSSNLVVEYRGSGLGYAGNPTSMDVAPFVTVRLTGMTFSSIILFGATIGLPDFSYTLTIEDATGTGSN